MNDKQKVETMLKGAGTCNHCGAEQNSSICCRTGKNRYIFDWVGGGFNDTNADSPEEAYEKVVEQNRGKTLKPVKDSFRLYTNEEYARLLKAYPID